jgi:hypothetical protein
LSAILRAISMGIKLFAPADDKHDYNCL